MKEYIVTVTEIMEQKVSVEAESENDAIWEVEQMYDREEIVLDSGDFIGAEFTVRFIDQPVEPDPPPLTSSSRRSAPQKSHSSSHIDYH